MLMATIHVSVFEILIPKSLSIRHYFLKSSSLFDLYRKILFTFLCTQIAAHYQINVCGTVKDYLQLLIDD